MTNEPRDLARAASQQLAQQRRDQAEKDDREAARLIDYAELFGSERGERVLGDLMRRCHVFDTIAVEDKDGRLDQGKTLIREGMRLVPLMLREDMERGQTIRHTRRQATPKARTASTPQEGA